MIHAGFLDRRMWDEQFNSFGAEGFRVIRYDMRGLGKSDKPKSKYDDATDLMELLDRVGWNEKSCIIGISSGVVLRSTLPSNTRLGSSV
ncbi:MAG: alpha/beta fold hydrolase [Nitrososphaerota archaeon]|nr:alpha/beta fold hydrolase [Nitrososphaerota archaeon]